MSDNAQSEPMAKEKPSSFAKTFFFAAMSILISFAMIESGVRLVEPMASRFGVRRIEDLSVFSDKEMARTLFRDEIQSAGKVQPFGGWGHREFHGKYTNIDSDSVRRSWNPSVSSTGSIQVLVFGGSAAWGLGARDDYTIPSDISKVLNSGGGGNRTYFVRNYAEIGYSAMQAAVRLLSLLEKGERPDLAIFYIGANEVWSVYDTGVAGVAGQELESTAFYEQAIYRTAWGRIKDETRRTLADHCHSCRVAVNIVRIFSPAFLTPRFDPRLSSRLDTNFRTRLAKETADDYQINFARFVNQIASAYHFQAVILWQPTLFTEPKRVGEENLVGRYDWFSADKRAEELYQEVHHFIRSDPERNFFDLSQVLIGRTKECYIDWVHLSEDCNMVVSRNIVEILNAHYLQGNDTERRH